MFAWARANTGVLKVTECTGVPAALTLNNSHLTQGQHADHPAGRADASIVRLSLSGDSRAQEELVRRYQKLVYNVLYQMVRDHEAACDLTQDTFVKAFRALHTFRMDSRFKPWLLKIATNSGLNWLRDRRPEDSLEGMLEDNPGLEPAARQNVESEVEWRLSQALLHEALAGLPVRSRHIFVLRYQHDMTYEDIAQTVGEPETTIKSVLFRAREKLRKLILAKMAD